MTTNDLHFRRGRRYMPRRTMVYGPPGIGKSSFGAASRRAIFIPTEDGLDDIDCDSFPVCGSLGDVFGRIGDLVGGRHDFGTVVVDTLDWLERLIWADVCHAKQVSNIEDIGYGKGFGFALSPWQQVLDGFDALRVERGMEVILLAHAKTEKYDNPQTNSYDRFVPRLHKTAAHLVVEWCNEVLFCNYKVFVKETDAGFNRTRAQGVGDGERVLYTSDRPSHVAKNRLSLPAEMPFDWREYQKYLPAQENGVAAGANYGDAQRAANGTIPAHYLGDAIAGRPIDAA